MERVHPELLGSCINDSLLIAIEKAMRSKAKHKTIVYVGGGEGYCSRDGETEWQYLKETLRQVAAKNAQRITIHALEIPGETNIARQTFLKRLADQNGGRYKRVAK